LSSPDAAATTARSARGKFSIADLQIQEGKGPI
jgi:hypothetical protein